MKKILIGVGALIVIVVAVIAVVWTNLDSIVKEAIQTYGTEATKSEVRVDSVKLKLTDGKARIEGLTVANPKGFTDPYIFTLGEISTKIDIASIKQNPIIIDEILIKAPAVVYEINESGLSNTDMIKENVGGGGNSKGKPSSSKSEELKMIIRRLVVEGSSAKVRIAALDKEESVSMPKIVMTDVGKKSGGATAVEVALQLSDRMLRNLERSVAKIGVEKYLGKNADDIKALMQKKVGVSGDEKPNIGGVLKGLLDN